MLRSHVEAWVENAVTRETTPLQGGIPMTTIAANGGVGNHTTR